jgi:prefoldin subunit 5
MSDLQDRNNQAIVSSINELNKKLNKVNDEIMELRKRNALLEREITQMKTQLMVAITSSKGRGPTSGN